MKVIIVLPVYNEELVLEKNVMTLIEYCHEFLTQYDINVVISDNGSDDHTADIAKNLANKYPEVTYIFTPDKGKGNAWRWACLSQEADVYCMMDVDLATNLQSLHQLIAQVLAGSDLVIGSRFLPTSQVEQSPLRMLVSRSYIGITNILFRTRISDFQCGFKAFNKTFCRAVLAKTKDSEFFLDTEMIIVGLRSRYVISEIPINWSGFSGDGRRSTVNITTTIIAHLMKLIKLKMSLK